MNYFNKPITTAFIQCLQSFNNNDFWNNSIKNFRQKISSENSKLEGSNEIEPKLVYAFIFKELCFFPNNNNNGKKNI